MKDWWKNLDIEYHLYVGVGLGVHYSNNHQKVLFIILPFVVIAID